MPGGINWNSSFSFWASDRDCTRDPYLDVYNGGPSSCSNWKSKPNILDFKTYGTTYRSSMNISFGPAEPPKFNLGRFLGFLGGKIAGAAIDLGTLWGMSKLFGGNNTSYNNTALYNSYGLGGGLYSGTGLDTFTRTSPAGGRWLDTIGIVPGAGAGSRAAASTALDNGDPKPETPDKTTAKPAATPDKTTVKPATTSEDDAAAKAKKEAEANAAAAKKAAEAEAAAKKAAAEKAKTEGNKLFNAVNDKNADGSKEEIYAGMVDGGANRENIATLDQLEPGEKTWADKLNGQAKTTETTTQDYKDAVRVGKAKGGTDADKQADSATGAPKYFTMTDFRSHNEYTFVLKGFNAETGKLEYKLDKASSNLEHDNTENYNGKNWEFNEGAESLVFSVNVDATNKEIQLTYKGAPIAFDKIAHPTKQ